MTGKWHRSLVVAAGIIVKVGALVVITDPSALGVSAENWKIIGGWLALAGSLASDIATVLRANLIPNTTTGIGNEITRSKETGEVV